MAHGSCDAYVIENLKPRSNGAGIPWYCSSIWASSVSRRDRELGSVNFLTLCQALAFESSQICTSSILVQIWVDLWRAFRWGRGTAPCCPLMPTHCLPSSLSLSRNTLTPFRGILPLMLPKAPLTSADAQCLPMLASAAEFPTSGHCKMLGDQTWPRLVMRCGFQRTTAKFENLHNKPSCQNLLALFRCIKQLLAHL